MIDTWKMPDDPLPHWTDHVSTRPIFSTVIPAQGPAGNINNILGAAKILLRQIGVPQDRIDALNNAVIASQSYEEAIGHIERWFRVDRDLE